MLAIGQVPITAYASPKELEEMRNEQRRARRADALRWPLGAIRDPKDAPAGVAAGFVSPQGAAKLVRPSSRMPLQGEVKVENAVLDDMILLRADGTPTYTCWPVVVDPITTWASRT